MFDLSSMKSLLSGKDLTELCTLKNAYEILTGKDLDTVEGELVTYLKGQLRSTEVGIVDIVTGSNGSETIANITDLPTAELVKTQLKQLAVKAIEQGDDALLVKINELISLSVDKAAELVDGVASKVTGKTSDTTEATTEETTTTETTETTEETPAATEEASATTEATTETPAAETTVVEAATEQAAPTVTVTPVQ